MTHQSPPLDPTHLLRPKRKVEGISAILLPFLDDAGTIDWPGFRAHVTRTLEAGLTPAVNMDTGYANLIDDATRTRVLDETAALTGNTNFAAGAFVADHLGAPFARDAYFQQIDAISQRGGTPVIFQSFGLVEQSDDDLITSYEHIGAHVDRFIAFELGTMFAPFGRIYSLDAYRRLMNIKSCIGAKHSSLKRVDEWQRLILRDEVRPDFRVYTGNDLAIDMIMYGSDYLLGLSSFAPDLFAIRDAYWETGDARFYELNDTLQYLGAFAFRAPVPAYKHSAAMFLKLRGWIDHDATHPDSLIRPESDRAILAAILNRLEAQI